MDKEKDVFKELYDTIEDRKINPAPSSYTNYLFREGIDKILKKVGEESSEVIIASKNASKDDIIYEIADLVYHIEVLMSLKGITINDLADEMKKRTNKIGNKKEEKKLPSFH